MKELKDRRDALRKECEDLTGKYMDDVKRQQEDMNLKSKMLSRMAELKGIEDTIRAVHKFITDIDFSQCGDYDTLKEVLLNEVGGSGDKK